MQEHEVEVLVIDNFGRAFPGKESEEKKMKDFFDGIDSLGTKCPSLQRGMIFFLHHVTKPSREGPAPDLLTDPYGYLGRVRGSGRLHDLIGRTTPMMGKHIMSSTVSFAVLRSHHSFLNLARTI